MGTGKQSNPTQAAFRSRIVGEGEEAPDQLLANPLNWRVHPKEQVDALEGLLKQVGWVQRVIVNRRTGHVVDGHARVALALRRHELTLPVLYVDLSEDEERLVLAAIDPIGGMAGRDDDMLAQVLNGLEAQDEGLRALLDSLKGEEAGGGGGGSGDPDDTPDVQPDPVTEAGEVWLLGAHRVMCGDSARMADVRQLMAGGQADLVWTDPPYNVAIKGKAGTILNDDMADSQFRDFLRSVYSCYFSAMRPGACIYVAHADSERANFTLAFVEAGLKFSQVLIWVKQSATLSRQDFNWQHEPILYGWKEGAGHYFCGDFTRTTVIDDDIDLKAMKREQLIQLVNDMRNQAKTTAVRHDRPTKSDLHPTMKPVGLVQRMIEWSSKDGEVVLDLFGGSGTTLIAADKVGRTARLMELDPRFADVIVRRWQKFTGKAATLEGDGRTFDEIAAERVPAEA